AAPPTTTLSRPRLGPRPPPSATSNPVNRPGPDRCRPCPSLLVGAGGLPGGGRWRPRTSARPPRPPRT
ncbi:MAG: hypothetical protein AVDCRST_MAG66-577, partial [uncultured Pseudonocardia sp.]